MANDTRNLEFFRRLHVVSLRSYYGNFGAYKNVESPVETHLEVPLIIFRQSPQETLLEDCGHERIGDDHESVGSVCKRFHFEETDLVETPGVDVDSVPIG